MNRYEYKITSHTAESFERVSYFCTEDGKCSLGDIPGEQVHMLMSILNEQGGLGWELVQLIFGRGGILAFWKRIANG